MQLKLESGDEIDNNYIKRISSRVLGKIKIIQKIQNTKNNIYEYKFWGFIKILSCPPKFY